MATFAKRTLKNGQIVYDVQVYVNGKFKSKTWKRPKEITNNKEADLLLKKFAIEFEESCRYKNLEYKSSTTFEEFSNEWLSDSKKNNALTYYSRSKEILKDVNKLIGNIPLNQLKPIHIKRVLDYINDKKIVTEIAVLKQPLDDVIKDKKIRQISVNCGFSFTTFLFARKGTHILWSNAEKIAKELNIDVNKYFDKIKSEKPYSKGSKDKYKRTINAVLNRAVQLDLIEKNPAKKVFTKNSISGEEKEKVILTLEESEKLQNALINTHNAEDLKKVSAIGLLYFMAMRLGEVSGLEWKDIDFDKNTIFIQRSSTYINKEFGIVTKKPKTLTSIRKIKMPQSMATILKEYKVWYEQEKQRLKGVWQDTDRVITQWDGKAIFPGTIAQWLTSFLLSNGIKKVSPHSLRHTNITIQLRNKIPPKAVARFVGHSDPSVTLDVYSHFLEEDEDDFVDLFDNLFNKSKK